MSLPTLRTIYALSLCAALTIFVPGSARPVAAATSATPATSATSATSATPATPATPAPAPVKTPAPDKTVRYALYKFLQRIGFERDTYTAISAAEPTAAGAPGTAGGIEAKAVFTFQDRGTPVPLSAFYWLKPDGSLDRYQVFGNTARGIVIDARVVARGNGSFTTQQTGQPGGGERRVQAGGPVAAIAAYAPLLGQQLLFKTWLKHGRPATITLLPAGSASITGRGKETYSVAGKTVVLEHLAVQGLVWGREDAWLDEAQELVAVVTRDAEFDHFEGVREGFGPLLPELVKRAGADAVAWLSEVARGADRSPKGAVALVGGRLIDGNGGPPVEDAVVVYEGDRILAAGPRARTPVPAGAAVLDASGQTLLPGLWDMHAHLEQVEQGAAYLAAGVTTVRDLGNIMEFITAVRDTIDSGKGLGPRVLVDCLVDGEGRQSVGTVRISKAADIAPMLDQFKRAGCLEVKLYSSIRPELVRPIAEQAHRRGLRVTGHIPDDMDVVQALEAGYDGIDHIPYVIDPLLPRAEREKLTPAEVRRRLGTLDLNAPAVRRVLDKLAARKPVFDDTIALFELFRHTTEENQRREPGIAKVPRELRGLYDGVDPSEAAEHEAVFSKLLAVLGELHRRGVPIVAGTDIAVPGHSLHRELELYVQAGFTPMAAIQAATLVPARSMGRGAELGTIERGKRADLCIVAGNPLTDIRDIRKVVRVVARGRLYDPGALWRLVGFTP